MLGNGEASRRSHVSDLPECGLQQHQQHQFTHLQTFNASQQCRQMFVLLAQLMHSQMKEAAPAECLDVEPSMLRLLVATRSSSSSRTPYVTSHSLSPEASFLGEQSAYRLPPLRPAGAPAFHRASQVLLCKLSHTPVKTVKSCSGCRMGSIAVRRLSLHVSWH